MNLAGGIQYHGIENNPLLVAFATTLVDSAGQRHGQGRGRKSAEDVQQPDDENVVTYQVGMMFFDRHQPSYTADLSQLGLMYGSGRG